MSAPTTSLRQTLAEVSEPAGYPPAVRRAPIVWVYLIPILLLHLLSLFAFVPWLFSWTGFWTMVVGVFVFGQGINLCYHRLLAHRSFKVPRWLERQLVVVALCCMEDTPIKWVSTHRYHHVHSDEHEDPHSPLVTFLWGHIGWLMWHNRETRSIDAYHRYSRDLLDDPFYLKLERSMLLGPAIYAAHAVLFFLVGCLIGLALAGTALGSLQMGLSMLVWGVYVRTVAVWHITWSVNSLTHLFGYRNYATKDNSRNNWLVALLAVGEGWHNNHHHDPASATVQHRWWEIDPTYYAIKFLEKLGLATDVIQPRHRRQQTSREV